MPLAARLSRSQRYEREVSGIRHVMRSVSGVPECDDVAGAISAANSNL